jgi:hypothetical protein
MESLSAISKAKSAALPDVKGVGTYPPSDKAQVFPRRRFPSASVPGRPIVLFSQRNLMARSKLFLFPLYLSLSPLGNPRRQLTKEKDKEGRERSF